MSYGTNGDDVINEADVVVDDDRRYFARCLSNLEVIDDDDDGKETFVRYT